MSQLDQTDPNCGVALEPTDDVRSSPTDMATFGEVAAARMGRRGFLKGALGTTAYAALAISPATMLAACGDDEVADTAAKITAPDFKPGSLAQFTEISHGVSTDHVVAPGYQADILIRWGDPVTADAPAFEPGKADPDAQEKQFGYNNDFLGFVPLNADATRGVLCVNHEFTSRSVMFPYDLRLNSPKELAATEMAAHGGSIIEIAQQDDGSWQVVPDSKLNRRISTRSTAMGISGPAAGHARMQTNADPTGTQVIGTLNNCAGGITPYNSYLMAEENFHFYFRGKLDDSDRRWRTSGELKAVCEAGHATHPEARNFCRYGVAMGGGYDWGRHFDRFDINKEPNEANRFGWVVEVDPLDPASTPVKRTALGRFKHEGAESVVNSDGRLVIYMGDDQRFDYLYRFVTEGTVNEDDRAANFGLLDTGVLSVAKFSEDGSLTWMPLVHGQGDLTAENGFDSQADVMIETRRAADLLGATPMDRPEDVEPNPVTGKVYVALTNNSKRSAAQLDAVHDRGPNYWGLIVEMTPPDGDHAADSFAWDVLVKAGDPSVPQTGAQFAEATTANGWFACPDNLAVDPSGRLWVTTDQGGGWSLTSGSADGVWCVGTEGEDRGTSAMFYRVPAGAEMCGPCFTPTGDTLFVAVQHPGTDGALAFAEHGRASDFEDPMTRWPDFDANTPPRPSVVVIRKEGGGPIG
jgi:secreted PhoX family phosphatase